LANISETLVQIKDDGDDHCAKTALVMAENSHNEAGGKILPPKWSKKVSRAALSNS